MIEIIKAAFAAGEVKTFLIQGEYLEILEAAYPIDVAMLDRSGAQLSVMRNAEASYFSRPGRYEVVQVTSPLAQTVRIFVGSGDAGTRKTSGAVVVIDGGKIRTFAGETFISALASPALAANHAWCQIFNPIGSKKNIIISKFSISSAVSQPIRFGVGLGSIGGTSNGGMKAKKSGAIDSSAICYNNNLPGLPANFLYFGQLNILSNGVLIYELREPLILTEGYGFSAGTTAVGSDINLTTEAIEENQ